MDNPFHSDNAKGPYPMAWGRTDEQKQAEKALREEQARIEHEQLAQAAHAATPIGRAEVFRS